jgi:hypothetical protein
MSQTQTQAKGIVFLHADFGENRIEYEGRATMRFQKIHVSIRPELECVLNTIASRGMIREGEAGETYEIMESEYLQIRDLIWESNRRVKSDAEKIPEPAQKKSYGENGGWWNAADARL